MADAAAPTEKKDMLLSQGAHEIRSPLSVILGYVRMLMSGRMGSLTDSQRKVVQEIGNSATKLAGIADEMSSLARLLAGNARLVRAQVELAPLIAAEIPSVTSLPDRDVNIRLIDDASGAIVFGDAKNLGVSFNSLMFSHRRELVTSEELCVAIDRAAGGGQATVRVSIGGADRIEELRRVPLSELGPLVEFRSGLGYRLSVARHVIEAHGGRTFSKTEPGVSPQASPLVVGAVIILPEA